MSAIAFGLAVGFGIGAWRDAPPLSRVSSIGLLLVVLVAMWASWRAGRRARFGSSGVAVAVASAEAVAAATAAGGQSIVQVVIGDGARAAGARRWGGLDGAEWMGSDRSLLEEHSGALEDLDPVEVLEAADSGGSEAVREAVRDRQQAGL